MTSSTDWPVYSPFAREHFGRGREEGLAEGKAKGKAEGEAKALLVVLTARGLDISDENRTRIQTCTDLTQLEIWLARALTARTIQDLFDAPDIQNGP
ncbi:hypothetical protein AB0I81_02810 [Nonomuraea sp. NPDC050404]|uniref:hypothetical protein n=1 Tax=Nonomuraea sp. NPDC050404 TaxID=3155783 RepID=UPI0033D43F65